MYQAKIKKINSYKEIVPLYMEFLETYMESENKYFSGLLEMVNYNIIVFLKVYDLHFDNDTEKEIFLTNFPLFFCMYYKLNVQSDIII